MTIAEFEIDHVIARKHNGSDSFENLAWTCFRCNAHKGTDLASVDPQSGKIATLFNPRKNKWHQHSELKKGVVHGFTPKARATIALLRMNEQEYVNSRREYFELHPDEM